MRQNCRRTHASMIRASHGLCGRTDTSEEYHANPCSGALPVGPNQSQIPNPKFQIPNSSRKLRSHASLEAASAELANRRERSAATNSQLPTPTPNSQLQKSSTDLTLFYFPRLIAYALISGKRCPVPLHRFPEPTGRSNPRFGAAEMSADARVSHDIEPLAPVDSAETNGDEFRYPQFRVIWSGPGTSKMPWKTFTAVSIATPLSRPLVRGTLPTPEARLEAGHERQPKLRDVQRPQLGYRVSDKTSSLPVFLFGVQNSARARDGGMISSRCCENASRNFVDPQRLSLLSTEEIVDNPLA